ncbi:Probable alkaline/neutral invertase B [Linum perenne]
MLEVPGDLSSVISDQDELDLLKVLVNPLMHSTAPGTGRRSSFNGPRSQFVAGVDSQLEEAWAALRKSLVVFRGQRVGTIATTDNSDENLNYDQVFVRDFIPSGLAFLMNRVPEIVKNFILKTLRSWEKKIDRVAPVDYGFWWIFLLRAYTRSTGDTTLAELPECQMAMQLILSLCLSEGFNTFPTLLRTDGCSMIESQMVSSCRTLSQFASYEWLATVLIVS